MTVNHNKIIVVTGPTAVGKTDITIELAQCLNTEIISADSRQFYREMSIGNAVPSQKQLATVQHHFIHSETIDQPISAVQFAKKALPVVQTIHQKSRHVIVTGGSGLYIDALLFAPESYPPTDQQIRQELTEQLKSEGLASLVSLLKREDPIAYQRIDHSNSRRVIRALEVIRIDGRSQFDYHPIINPQLNAEILFVILERNRQELYRRIEQRVDDMIQSGLENEAKKIYKTLMKNHLTTVGYREWIPYFYNVYDRKEVIRLIKRNTRRYAKRQMTWFRKYEQAVHIDLSKEEQPVAYILKQLD